MKMELIIMIQIPIYFIFSVSTSLFCSFEISSSFISISSNKCSLNFWEQVCFFSETTFWFIFDYFVSSLKSAVSSLETEASFLSSSTYGPISILIIDTQCYYWMFNVLLIKFYSLMELSLMAFPKLFSYYIGLF